MAARRLLIILLGVLLVSTLAAALIGPEPAREPAPGTTTRAEDGGVPQESHGTGRLIEVSVQTGEPRPETIRLRPGDQLELTVRGRTPGQVEIPSFGLIDDLGPDSPAHFSLLAAEPGNLAVRLVGTGRSVARVVILPEHGGSGHPRGSAAEKAPRGSPAG